MVNQPSTHTREGFAPTGAPLLYTTQHQEDPAVVAAYHHRESGWTWYVTEYDPAEGVAFGLVSGFELELGYFTLQEILESGGVRVPSNFTTLSQARAANTPPPNCERCGGDRVEAEVCGDCGHCQTCGEHSNDCICEMPALIRYTTALIRSLADL